MINDIGQRTRKTNCDTKVPKVESSQTLRAKAKTMSLLWLSLRHGKPLLLSHLWLRIGRTVCFSGHRVEARAKLSHWQTPQRERYKRHPTIRVIMFYQPPLKVAWSPSTLPCFAWKTPLVKPRMVSHRTQGVLLGLSSGGKDENFTLANNTTRKQPKSSDNVKGQNS